MRQLIHVDQYGCRAFVPKALSAILQVSAETKLCVGSVWQTALAVEGMPA